MSGTPNGSGLGFAPVDISSAGPNVVIPGLSGGIFVRRVVLVPAVQTTILFRAGDRQLSGRMSVDFLALSFSDQAYYVVNPGEDFIIELGDAIQTGGTIWYQRGPL